MPDSFPVLVTGGAGYIGSHTCVALLQAGYAVVVVDNLCNSKATVIQRIETITAQKVDFYPVDLRSEAALEAIFARHRPQAVIHFAGLKAVGESVTHPWSYYQNNLVSTLTLCQVMAKWQVNKIVFSSSATVYGDPERVPIPETSRIAPTNPYGHSKAMIEQILTDIATAKEPWSVVSLRYFNPVGAHESGLIGEDPRGIPNNLVPYISQVAVGQLPALAVFGNDYPTPDGTGVRDYIHVMDLAHGHLRALEKIAYTHGVMTYNLGTGTGYSVLAMIAAFEKACGRTIPYTIKSRRPGDIAVCYANPAKAKQELFWQTTRTIQDMCQDAWRWQSSHPQGLPE